jgi:hypothetical protein
MKSDPFSRQPAIRTIAMPELRAAFERAGLSKLLTIADPGVTVQL